MKTTAIACLKSYNCRADGKFTIYKLWDFFRNIDFQRSEGGLTFSEKYHNFTFVLSGMYLMTKCGKSGIKAVYNYKKKDSAITRGRQNTIRNTTPFESLTS